MWDQGLRHGPAVVRPFYNQTRIAHALLNTYAGTFFHLFSIIKLQNFLPFWSPEKVCVNTNQVKYMPISVNAKCY